MKDSKMKGKSTSEKMLYLKKNNDECYTPAYAVKPILEYIKLYLSSNLPKRGFLIVWCPFDKEFSEFVKLISELDDVVVIASHIDYKQDFFKYKPSDWDIIVSNPPFTNKRLFFERALSFGKPFALIMSNTWLNDKYSKFVFHYADREMQILFFDRRIHFLQDGVTDKNTTFSSSYYCSDFLPKQIIIKELVL